MSLHPLAARFADVADAYERGRPDYAPGVVGAIAAELSLPARASVLDLAAGTGKLTRALVHAGLDVIAVEPQAAMREILAARVGEEHVREGTAEAIPLADSSVHAVTVADAFHWFDHAAALEEIRRVLRPGGALAVITTAPDFGGASWAHDVGTLIAEARPEHPGHDGPPWQDSVRAAAGFGEPREIRVTDWQPASAARMLDYVSSISWVAAMSEDSRAALLARVAELIEEGEMPPTLGVHFLIGLASVA
jgi:SAM-dependent methyltransferase